ncbi:MAG: hypothetical protein NTX79_03415 [Candidatus Micrarchaeota archaeon]|nr:hypothetical protein [Candidatus Micrarchaeota archaeon]
MMTWQRLPYETIRHLLEKWVQPIAVSAQRHAFGNFSGRHLSYSGDGRLVEIRAHAIPISSNSSPAAANSFSSFANRALTHGKMP